MHSNLYFFDSNNHAIRVVTSSNDIKTLNYAVDSQVKSLNFTKLSSMTVSNDASRIYAIDNEYLHIITCRMMSYIYFIIY